MKQVFGTIVKLLIMASLLMLPFSQPALAAGNGDGSGMEKSATSDSKIAWWEKKLDQHRSSGVVTLTVLGTTVQMSSESNALAIENTYYYPEDKDAIGDDDPYLKFERIGPDEYETLGTVTPNTDEQLQKAREIADTDIIETVFWMFVFILGSLPFIFAVIIIVVIFIVRRKKANENATPGGQYGVPGISGGYPAAGSDPYPVGQPISYGPAADSQPYSN